MNRLFVFNDEHNPYRNELEMGYSRFSNEYFTDRIELKFLSVNFLKSKKIDIVIADNLPQEWIFILKGMQIVSVIFGEVKNYHHEADIVIDFKGADSIKYFSGRSFSMSNPNFDFQAVVNVVHKLKWDSDFFDFPIAYIASRYLSDNIILHVEKFTKRNKIKLIQYLCNCHDNLSVKVAEKNGYHFTDIRITFHMSLKKDVVTFEEKFFKGKFGLANIEHLDMLSKMTNMMYEDSRYFYDGNFDLEKINRFYSEWVIKAVKGTFDHECYCYFEDNVPRGFCTVRYDDNNIVNIGLFGVDREYTGRGIGKSLLKYVLSTMKLRGLDKIYVVTQGRNYSAQKLYQDVGFRTFTTELWYHKWIN